MLNMSRSIGSGGRDRTPRYKLTFSRTPALTMVMCLAGACQGEAPPASEQGAVSDPSVAGPGREVVVIEAVVPDDPTCASCVITVEDLLRLEDSPISPIPEAPIHVVEDTQGRFWLVFVNDLPLVYAADC